ncbi:MAG: DUF1611 domain-containing protein [Alphaproteobacteria bacterium]|nr:DUF1611 domain-containing protein [Alphaproteobacteria bacterium]
MAFPKPYVVFLGDVDRRDFAKTAFGLRDWAAHEVIGQVRLPGCTIDLGIPDYSVIDAARSGARALVIGVAAPGGALPASWEPELVAAIEAGLDIVSGLHSRLSASPAIAQAAKTHGRNLHDVRHSNRDFPIGTGRKRTGRRLLTVGTDCALGKKYTALAMVRELRQRGVAADFRATGQTGIMIAGDGVALDAVVSDFLAGAAEALSPDAAPDHWDVIEGQGSLFHPSYAAVTLGLVHGSQPDAMILCHDPSRPHIAMFPDYPLPDLPRAIRVYEEAASLTRPGAKVTGISLNTADLGEAAARRAIAEAADITGLAATDPLRFGCAELVDKLRELTLC